MIVHVRTVTGVMYMYVVALTQPQFYSKMFADARMERAETRPRIAFY